MPTREVSTNNICIYIDEEHCIPLTSISDVSVSEEDLVKFGYEDVYVSGELTFEIKPPKSFRELDQFIELFHPNLSWLSWWMWRYGSNNWRKLHGLPMMRRKNDYSERRT